MLEKAREIIIKLASFQDVSYEHFPNSSRFKIISKNGVKWSSRASKLGNIHYSDDHEYCIPIKPLVRNIKPLNAGN